MWVKLVNRQSMVVWLMSMGSIIQFSTFLYPPSRLSHFSEICVCSLALSLPPCLCAWWIGFSAYRHTLYKFMYRQPLWFHYFEPVIVLYRRNRNELSGLFDASTTAMPATATTPICFWGVLPQQLHYFSLFKRIITHSLRSTRVCRPHTRTMADKNDNDNSMNDARQKQYQRWK